MEAGRHQYAGGDQENHPAPCDRSKQSGDEQNSVKMGSVKFVLGRDSAISHKQFLSGLSVEKVW